MTQGSHPYADMDNTAFWSRSVAKEWDANELFVGVKPLLLPEDRIVSAGSCFAANIVPYLEAAGFHYVRTEHLEERDDRFNYSRYSSAYGNIYTARQFVQLIRRCNGNFVPKEDRWKEDSGIVDPFRPGLLFPAEDDAEFSLVTESHLEMTLEALKQADVFIFTLGLTETWMSSLDGAVFPACPGTVAGKFDAERHKFINFQAADVVDDLRAAISELRSLNPQVRIILTVSPVPLAATATGKHVYVANFYSKSVLRVACEQIANSNEDVVYFPAFEMVLGIDAYKHFDPDLRSVNEIGVKRVVTSLLRHSVVPAAGGLSTRHERESLTSRLSQSLVRRECEELMNDPYASRTRLSNVGS